MSWSAIAFLLLLDWRKAELPFAALYAPLASFQNGRNSLRLGLVRSQSSVMAGYGVVSPPTVPSAQFNGYPAAPPAQYGQQVQQQQKGIRPGTLPPGTCIKIGDYEVTIERFLSEGALSGLLLRHDCLGRILRYGCLLRIDDIGGFAHVYLVRSSQPIPSPAGSSETYHVLKRVAAADKPVLREIRWEVDVMVHYLILQCLARSC